MSTKNTNVNIGLGGGFFMGLAIILMVVGYAMETAEVYPEIGAVLFTVGFWLFVIPLIVVVVILAIIFIALAKS